MPNEGDEDEHEALVNDRTFTDGSRLLIGRDIDDLDEVQEAVTDTLVWLLPAVLLLSLAGGALMSRAIGRRIESVAAAARGVIAGDLTERVALRGTGDDFDRLGETLNALLLGVGEAFAPLFPLLAVLLGPLLPVLTMLHGELLIRV